METRQRHAACLHDRAQLGAFGEVDDARAVQVQLRDGDALAEQCGAHVQRPVLQFDPAAFHRQRQHREHPRQDHKRRNDAGHLRRIAGQEQHGGDARGQEHAHRDQPHPCVGRRRGVTANARADVVAMVNAP
jgi:hypothetical protein